MSKTTLDLSTLSDITGGAHTVKVKAKASGYNDSEFSNEVSYTKASGYSGTINCTSSSEYSISYWENNGWHLKHSETFGENNVSGSIKYKVSLQSNVSGYQVTSYTNCVYEVDVNRWTWAITPSDNNFTFVFEYVG